MAFIHPYRTKSGEDRYRVFWWDPGRKKQAKVFKRRREADRFKREMEYSLDHGTSTDPARGRLTLGVMQTEVQDTRYPAQAPQPVLP